MPFVIYVIRYVSLPLIINISIPPHQHVAGLVHGRGRGQRGNDSGRAEARVSPVVRIPWCHDLAMGQAVNSINDGG